jgi:Mrp family chromosome partitioning ATPase
VGASATGERAAGTIAGSVLATYDIKGGVGKTAAAVNLAYLAAASAADVERMGMHQAPLPVFAARSPACRSFGHLRSEVKGRRS